MKTPKPRKEKLSIYLVKAGLEDQLAKVIKLEKAKPPIPLGLPELEATLHVKKEPPKPPPPWTRLFSEHQQLPEGLFGSRQAVGAVLTVSLSDRLLIISFGTGIHLINNETIERDFGLRVTLNSVDPEKLRSLDKASYDHNPLNSRTQSPIDLGVFELDIDADMDMLYAVTGVSAVPVFGSHVTGRDALTLVLDIKLDTLRPVLEEALLRYQQPLPKAFEWVENVQRVKDKDLQAVLDLELDDVLASNNFNDLWLGEPEIIDWESQIGYSFDLRPRTPRQVVLNLEDLVQYFQDKQQALTTDNLKAQAVHINDNEYQSVKRWSAYRCLYAEISTGEERYILRNGQWYIVNRDFVASVDQQLKALDPYTFDFPLYSQRREEDYNAEVARLHDPIELMDKKLIPIGGPYDKLEFCDLIKEGSEFIHIKYYRSSATLSHLFAQGFVAAEAFVGDKGFRTRLNKHQPPRQQTGLHRKPPRPC